MHDIRLVVIAGLALPGGLWLFFGAFGRMKLRLAVMDTPTSPIRSAAMGKVELKGLGRVLKAPLSGPFSGVSCIWYRWLVEEEHTDSKGNSHWSTIGEGSSSELFQLEDGSGTVLVDPQGAEIDAPRLFGSRSGSLLGSSPMPGPLAAEWAGGGFFSSPRRYSEWRLSPGLPLYVLGMLRPLEGGQYVGQGREGEPYLISVQDEAALIDSLFWGVWGRLVGGAVLALAGLAYLLYAFS